MRRRKSARPIFGYDNDKNELTRTQPETWRDTNPSFDYFRKVALKAEFGVPIRSEY
ncbi:hypothetical protein [Paenibacillus zeisoli]|uniref:hypothetical protein n=1 Tax=Paenibacillus zeisoli TaxID=2496267 RepID=UPI00163BF6B6|nr:hypothetical protein [Paenibacillus zeisoli]